MTREKHRLTVPQVRNAKQPGLVHDGGGLYLQVTAAPDGRVSKSWLLRYQSPSGRRREMGLGALEAIGLAQARERAEAARKLARDGIDPIADRKAAHVAALAKAAHAMTFKEAALAYLEGQRTSWRSPKHAAMWTSTLKAYAFPTIGALPVTAVDVSLVLKVLEPIWTRKTETASRVRGRIEAILDWAAVRGYRQGDNPARWRGHLQKVLPARSKVRPVRHHPALPFAEIPSFMTALRTLDGLGAMALELTILTATRSGEMLGARWREMDLDRCLWTIPAERMKATREHRIPLSRPAVSLLKRLRELGSKELVFPGQGTRGPLSGMAMLMTLRRMNRSGLTVHGFRSTFRDWAAERTAFPREVAEAALAHAIGDKTEAAYRRSDLFDKRRKLMEAWGRFCAAPLGGEVVSIASASGRKRAEVRRSGES